MICQPPLAFADNRDIVWEEMRDDGWASARWVQKPLACDCVAYAYAPSGVGYLLPIVPLQRAWRQHGREWIKRYGQIRAQSVGYVSVSVPGPRSVLMSAIVDAMMVS